MSALLLMLAVYLLPAIIAQARQHPNRWAIFWLTMLFGWTFFAWGAAFIWAFTNPYPKVKS